MSSVAGAVILTDNNRLSLSCPLRRIATRAMSKGLLLYFGPRLRMDVLGYRLIVCHLNRPEPGYIRLLL